MTTTISDAELKRLLELAHGATPLPWNENTQLNIDTEESTDRPFILAACNAAPELVEEVLRLRTVAEILDRLLDDLVVKDKPDGDWIELGEVTVGWVENIRAALVPKEAP